MAEAWYVLHLRPRFEKCVQAHLEAKGYEVFLPTFESRRRWSDRIKTISSPLFPTYLFCRFDYSSRFPILVTPGVQGIVSTGRIPSTVDPQEISRIRQVLASGLTTRPCPYLKTGEIVRIETGPLEGLTGCVIREKSSDRLIVSVTLLMLSFSVEIDRRWITSLEAAPSALVAAPVGQ
jgi:transcription antitermination factor NusG